MTAPPICPYCNNEAELVDSIEVYGVSHGNIWLCRPCEAYVGVHRNDDLNRPLGTLANAQLREWRRAAHSVLDPLWRKKIRKEGCSKAEAWRAGYEWLSKQMGIPFERCHIGMFGLEECQTVVRICSPANLRILRLAKEAGLPHDTSGPDGEEGDPCRCWVEPVDGELMIFTTIDSRTPEICSKAAGTIIKCR